MVDIKSKDDSKKERNRSHNVTILNEDNFAIWKWNLKYNLMTLGLYDVTTDRSKYDQKLDNEAMFEIIGTISDKIKVKVAHCKSAYELYQAIEAIYSNQTSFQLTSLHMKLMNYKFKTYDKIGEGLSEIQSLVAKIKNSGENISDKMVEGIILSALPAQFSTFITVWKTINEKERTTPNLINRIMSEVEDKKISNIKEDKALLGRFKNLQVNKSGKTGLNFKKGRFQRNFQGNKFPNKSGHSSKNMCNYCKKPGHLINECRKLKLKQELESKSSNKTDDKNDKSDKRDKSPAVALTVKDESLLLLDLESNSWIADSGASCHMSSRKEWFTEFKALERPQIIRLGKGTIEGYGRGKIQTNRGILQNVLYVPELENNLYSISSATKLGMRVEYDDNSVSFIDRDTEQVLIEGQLRGSLYFLDMDVRNQDFYQEAHVAQSLSDWHQRFGHISIDSIKSMAKANIVEGLDIVGDNDKLECIDCALNKGKSASHPTRTTNKTEIVGASLHVDTVGPIRDTSLGGSEYFVLAKDEASGYRLVAFVKSKSEIPAEVKKFINKTELETNNKVLRLFSDNGTEYVNHDLTDFLNQRGIEHYVSAPYTPEQNGFIERDIQTVTQSARTMLNQSKLPRNLWAEAVNTAIYVLNRTPNSKQPDKTPYETWFGKKPNVQNLRIFGQYAVVNSPKHYRDGKWDTTGITMRFVGYTNAFNTFKFYSSEDDIVMISCNATFMKKKLVENKQNSDSNDDSHTIIRSRPVHEVTEEPLNTLSDTSISTIAGQDGTFIYDDTFYHHGQDDDDQMEISNPLNSTFTISSEVETNNPQDQQQVEIPNNLQMRWGPVGIVEGRLRPRKQINYNTEQANVASAHIEDEPANFKQAMNRNDSDKWYEAMQDEIKSLAKNEVWELVPRPSYINIVTNKWVLRIKRKTDGSIERYRARLVARGFTQVHGIDYNETFAPVVNTTTIRLLFAHAAKEGLHMRGFDVKAAFLYGYLDEVVYMEQPEGFADNTDRVCLLKKSLYGLKQAPRQWNKEFSNFLISLKLEISDHDRCIYYRLQPAKLIIAIYVDDGIIFAERESDINYVMEQLKKRFDIHEVDLSSFLGFQIEMDDNGICLHQENYIRKILKKFNMTNCNSIDNPSTISKNSKSEKEKELLDEDVPYREAIGSLLYAATTTRIDIAYAVNRASRDVSLPTTFSWSLVKRIMRYLKDREEGYLCYSKNADDGLVAYCDADLAGDESCKSTTGYVILFAGGPICWKSQRQTIVSLSSTEAELVGMCSLVKELIWIRLLAKELGIIDNKPTEVYCDNQSAIKLATSEKSVNRTRHMGIRAAYTREQIEEKEIEVKHVKSENQLADFLTKPLTSKRFSYNKNMLMFFLLLSIMCLKGESSLLEECKPIIWLPTHNYVDIGTTEYTIDWSILNPCESLRANFRKRRQVINTQGQWSNTGQIQGPHSQPHDPHLSNNIGPTYDGHVNQPTNVYLLPHPAVLENSQTANNKIEPNLEIFNLDSTDKIIAERTIQECNNMFNLVFMQKFNELASKAAILRDHRTKRGLAETIGNTLLRTVENTIGLAVVSNLIQTTWDYFDPSSTRNKLVKDEEILQLHQKMIEEFRHSFNVTHEIQKGIIESLVFLSRDLDEQKRQMNHMANLLPRVTWVSAYLQSRITNAAHDLKTIIEEFTYGRVAIKEIKEMFNLNITNIGNEDTKFISVDHLKPNILRLKFLVRDKSRDTFVYKVHPFFYWDNLTGDPTWMEYIGSKYLIHNQTSNCIKAIDEPIQKAIDEDCIIKDYVDPRVQKWRSIVSGKDIYQYKNACQIKKTIDYNYVYCFPENITHRMGTQRLPPYVVRIPISESFILAPNTDRNFTYKPKFRRLNITSNLEFPALDSIHLGHFPFGSESVDQGKFFDEIQRLRKLNDQLIRHQEASVSVIKGGGTWWSILILFIILTFITTSLVVYNFLINKKNYKGHRKIMQDLTDLKSVYSEVKIDCPNCMPMQSTSTISKKDKSKIEVGRDQSVNIHVHSHKPSELPVKTESILQL